MKKLAVVGFLGLFLGIGLLWCPPADAADNVKFYLGAEGVFSFTNFKNGGHNDEGGFDNTGTDLIKIIRPGAHLGLAFAGMVNIDLGFHYRGKLHFTTDSYVWGPVYYYETDVDAYSLMFSLFITAMPSSVLSPYFGGGVGGTKFTMSTDDTEVNGTVEISVLPGRPRPASNSRQRLILPCGSATDILIWESPNWIYSIWACLPETSRGI